ncbi:MAG: methyltransferase type 12, partial [Puniceicoccaceae bacterium MED-G30]
MSNNPYESDELLQQYLVFHYARPEEQLTQKGGPAEALDFPKRCALDGLSLESIPNRGRALDLGCAVGRSTFELARSFGEVVGIDYSHAFIDSANVLKDQGLIKALRMDEGNST